MNTGFRKRWSHLFLYPHLSSPVFPSEFRQHRFYLPGVSNHTLLRGTRQLLRNLCFVSRDQDPCRRGTRRATGTQGHSGAIARSATGKHTQQQRERVTGTCLKAQRESCQAQTKDHTSGAIFLLQNVPMFSAARERQPCKEKRVFFLPSVSVRTSASSEPPWPCPGVTRGPSGSELLLAVAGLCGRGILHQRSPLTRALMWAPAENRFAERWGAKKTDYLQARVHTQALKANVPPLPSKCAGMYGAADTTETASSPCRSQRCFPLKSVNSCEVRLNVSATTPRFYCCTGQRAAPADLRNTAAVSGMAAFPELPK